jgi:hypothetical protein
MPAIGQMLQTITVDRHEAGFRAGTKARKYNQYEQCEIKTA